MKKLLLTLLCLLGATSLWAQDVLYSVDFSGSKWNNTTNYSGTTSSKDGNWSVTNGANNGGKWNYFRLGAKSITKKDSYFSSKFSLTEQITKVELTVKKLRGTINSVTLESSDDAEFTSSQKIATGEAPTTNNKETTVTLTIETPQTDKYYRVVFNLTNNSSKDNGVLELSACKFYGASSDTREEAGLAWSAENFTAIKDGENEFPTLTKPDNITVDYSSTNENVATIDENGDITLLTAGTTEIKANFAGNDNYKPGYCTYLLTVLTKPEAPVFSVNDEEVYVGTNVSVTSAGATSLTYTIDYNDSTKEAVTDEIDGNTWSFTVNEDMTVTVYGSNEAGQSEEVKKIYTTKELNLDEFTAMFDFSTPAAAGTNGAYGMYVHNSSYQSGTYEKTVTSVSEKGVTISFSGDYRIWAHKDGNELRVMKDGSLTFAAPAGFLIEKIEVTTGPGNKMNLSGLTRNTWTADNTPCDEITFSTADRSDFAGINVYVVKAIAEPVFVDCGKTAQVGDVVTVKPQDESHKLTIRITEGSDEEEPAAAPMRAVAVTDWTEKAVGESHSHKLTVLPTVIEAYATDANGRKSGMVKLVADSNGNVTSIDNIEAESVNAPVEYYSLQGIRLVNPAAGTIVIRRQGSEVTKIRF